MKYRVYASFDVEAKGYDHAFEVAEDVLVDEGFEFVIIENVEEIEEPRIHE